MGLTVSGDRIAPDGREIQTFGTPEFPAAFFYDDFRIVSVPWHWHEELELILVTRGRQKVYLGKETAELEEGDGYFCNSGVLHHAEALMIPCFQEAIVADAGLIGEKDSIYYRKYAEPLLADTALPCRILRGKNPADARILAAFQQAWDAGSREEPGYELTVRSRFGEILFRLLSERGLKGQAAQASPSRIRSEARIKTMLSYMDLHCAEPLTIEDIAQSAGLSVSECLRCFHLVLSTTPGRFLTGLRLDRAANLLLGGDAPVSEIAASCGYEDPAYFARAFRKQYHMTPGQYRSSAQGR